MFCLSGLIGLLLVLTAEGRVGNSSQLTFCTETEQCLLFDLLCQTGQYDVRHYDSVKWVSTNESSYFMEMAAMRAFRRLFSYITGDNDSRKKIEMTSPVLVKIVEKSFWEPGVYTMSFMLPAEHQANPPNPTDRDVYIDMKPAMNVYALSYGGWMTSMKDKSKARELSANLDKAGAKYTKSYHFAAGYNSPMTMFNRHNEVWFVATDEPECSSSEELDGPFF